MSNNEKRRIVIYVTNGVANGRRQSLLTKFVEAVEYDPTCIELFLPRWRDLPFPTEVTCGVSDDPMEERTMKLLSQGVLVVKSSWILSCIAERKLLVPIDEVRFAVQLDRLRDKAPVKTILRHIRSAGQEPLIWQPHQDEVIQQLHHARLQNRYERAEDLESLLVHWNIPLCDVKRRERELFNFSSRDI